MEDCRTLKRPFSMPGGLLRRVSFLASQLAVDSKQVDDEAEGM